LKYSQSQVDAIWKTRSTGTDQVDDPHNPLGVLAVFIEANDALLQSMMVSVIGPVTPYSDSQPSAQPNREPTVVLKRSRPSIDSSWSDWSEISLG
jgi:hypothetical protein